MEVTGWIGILRKRWRLTLLLLVLTLVATAAVAARSGPYTAQSQLALLPSKHVSGIAGGNPYLSFGDADTLTADLLRRELTAPAAVAHLASEGYSGSYQVTDDPNTAGPVLDITVTGNNKAVVEQTLQGVTAAATTTLASMQTGLSKSDQITSIVVSYAPNATLSVSKKARTVVVVLGIGLLFTIAVPQAVDAAFAGGRRRRRFRVSLRPSARSAEASETEAVAGMNHLAERQPGMDHPAERQPGMDHPAERQPGMASERPVPPPVAKSAAETTIRMDPVSVRASGRHIRGKDDAETGEKARTRPRGYQ